MSEENSDNDRDDLRGSGSAMNGLIRRMAGYGADESESVETDETDEPASFDGGAREQTVPDPPGERINRAIRRAAGY